MKLTKEERKVITYQIGDIIEQKCRRCYYNRTSNECFSVNECKACPTGDELRQLGRYFDTQPKKNGGPRKRVPAGLTPEIVRGLNQQGIPDKKISIMYDRSFTYVGKLKKKWESEGKWTWPTNMREIKRGGTNA
ncbi:hypothetical protein CN290_28505 [Bacillus cereus]|uniref:Zinc-finger domain-containing protein n=1 Tax=Bacillus cereus TaxID=1396 RepID=A0A2A8XVD6_BACCE|nr:hypothetical protein [Bacillus cereus]PFC69923.1 hypothetical protein CN290_28505 [Bacillus cereus]PFR16490.1 hypothetical protein COK23_25310 [Bacillus cereus]